MKFHYSSEYSAIGLSYFMGFTLFRQSHHIWVYTSYYILPWNHAIFYFLYKTYDKTASWMSILLIH